MQVAGDGVDLVNGAIIHSKTKTPTGTIQKSTGSVELNGDLHGRVLFQTPSIFDSATNTLVNTGDQVYSGTIAGPRVRCTLSVVGTGKTSDGNPTFHYSGECRFANKAPAAPGS